MVFCPNRARTIASLPLNILQSSKIPQQVEATKNIMGLSNQDSDCRWKISSRNLLFKCRSELMSFWNILRAVHCSFNQASTIMIPKNQILFQDELNDEILPRMAHIWIHCQFGLQKKTLHANHIINNFAYIQKLRTAVTCKIRRFSIEISC